MSSEKKDAVAEVHEARNAGFTIFKTKWDSMRENSKFLRLNQYSEKQLSKMKEQNRVPYVLDYINAAVNTFQGIQRDKRTEIFYYGVEKNDEMKVEILNAVKESTFQVNNFVYTESDIFQDGITMKVGALGYEWSRETNKNGAMKLYRIPPEQLMWDANSMEFDHADATWVSRHRMFSKADLINRKPELKEEIEKMSWFADGEMSMDNVTSAYLDSIVDNTLGWVALIEHWKKIYDKRYFIRMPSGMIMPKYWKEKKNAENYIAEQVQKARAQDPNANGEGFTVFQDTTPLIEKTEVGGDLFISKGVIEENFYPVSFYHPFFVDRDWWCPVDILKDGQRYFNKMFAMADHWIGTMSKGLILYNKDTAPPDEVKQVQKAFNATGGMVGVSDIENYKIVESRGPAPQLFDMLGLARQNLEDNAGGRNFQGKKETASESGVAVRTRIEQGGLAGFVNYDNFRRFKMDVGQKLAWYLTTNMTYADTVRIQGEQLVQDYFQKFNADPISTDWFKKSPMRPGIGYLEVNTTGTNTIENLKVDVIVDEARWSVSKNQSTLQEISIGMQSNPNLAKSFPPETMVELMNLPFSEKEKAKQRMQQLEQMNMQLEQMKAIKPPSVSASLSDIMLLPPMEQAQMLEKYFGIKADPNVLAQNQNADKQAELQAKAMEMEMKMRESEQNLALKKAEGEQKMFIDMATAEQKLASQRESDEHKLTMQHLSGMQKL